MNTKQIKIELAEAARRGISEFLSTTRGANLVGARASVTMPTMTEVEIGVPGAAGVTFFTVKVKQVTGV